MPVLENKLKYSEEQLIAWTKPASDTEEQRSENAISMVKSAVDNYDWKTAGIIKPEVLLKGSYKSNTNVKMDSDVDIYLFFSAYFFEVDLYQEKIQNCEFARLDKGISCSTFREHTEKALNAKFGKETIILGAKAFKIHANSYRVDADVAPFVTAKSEWDSNKNGICFYDRNSAFFVNYPVQDDKNGVLKNKVTVGYYKKVVRILKSIRNDIGLETPSFLIESLVYNAPDSCFIDNSIYLARTYSQKIRNIFESIYNLVKTQPDRFYEVNGIKKLFSDKQSWKLETALRFMEIVYSRLEE